MLHSITTLPQFAPTFSDGENRAHDRVPQKDATIWRVSLSASLAFKLICDIGHLYPHWEQRPRVGAMLEADGAWTIYCWPRADPDSQLLLLMLGYGSTRLADASRWTGHAWVTGNLLGKVLAALAMRAYWDMTTRTADDRLSWIMALPKAGKP